MLKLHVLFAKVFSHQFVKSEHVLHENHRVSVSSSSRPPESMLTLLYLHFRCRWVRTVELLLEFIIGAFLRHPARYWARLLFNHRKMLYVFMRVEKQLTCVELNHYASHRPNVTWFIPHQIFEDNLWCSILPSVYDKSVPLFVIGSASEVNHSDIRTNRTIPGMDLRLRSGTLAAWKARRGVTFTFIWTVNFFFCLYLNRYLV